MSKWNPTVLEVNDNIEIELNEANISAVKFPFIPIILFKYY